MGLLLAAALAAVFLPVVDVSARLPEDLDQLTDRDSYHAACANCQGTDGRGLDPALAGFEQPLPDFTDCGFAAREPDADWIAVAHEGGPVRGFSEMMPAFRGALTAAQLARVVRHIRSLCTDPSWPRGELNLPRSGGRVAVVGRALEDLDFGAGADRVRYSVAVDPESGPFTAAAELWFQPIAFRWVENLAAYDSFERERFVSWYRAMAAGSAIELTRATAVVR